MPDLLDRWYRGVRDGRGACFIEIVDGDQPVGRPLAHHALHSPTGFEWGYGGSGPADTARCLLREHLGFFPHPLVYQSFKGAVVQGLPKDTWVLTAGDLDVALRRIRGELHVRCLKCLDRGFTDLGGARCDCAAGVQCKTEYGSDT
jgi:hypothetical protein